MIKLSNKKSQIKSGSRKELSKFLASKHKYPSLLCKRSKNTHHKIKAVFSLKDSFFGQKTMGQLSVEQKRFRRRFLGQLSLGKFHWGKCRSIRKVRNQAKSGKLPTCQPQNLQNPRDLRSSGSLILMHDEPRETSQMAFF